MLLHTCAYRALIWRYMTLFFILILKGKQMVPLQSAFNKYANRNTLLLQFEFESVLQYRQYSFHVCMPACSVALCGPATWQQGKTDIPDPWCSVSCRSWAHLKNVLVGRGLQFSVYTIISDIRMTLFSKDMWMLWIKRS